MAQWLRDIQEHSALIGIFCKTGVFPGGFIGDEEIPKRSKSLQHYSYRWLIAARKFALNALGLSDISNPLEFNRKDLLVEERLHELMASFI